MAGMDKANLYKYGPRSGRDDDAVQTERNPSPTSSTCRSSTSKTMNGEQAMTRNDFLRLQRCDQSTHPTFIYPRSRPLSRVLWTTSFSTRTFLAGNEADNDCVHSQKAKCLYNLPKRHGRGPYESETRACHHGWPLALRREISWTRYRLGRSGQ